jgi:hypothetical protein
VRTFINNFDWPRLLALFIWLFVVATSLVPFVPLTYDEAWNFSNIVVHGSRWIATNYPFPNNHVLFSLIQSILLPETLIESYWPPLLRLVNVVLGLILLVLFDMFLKGHNLNKRSRATILLIVVFGAPIYTTYFFVARGYLLACGLLLLSLTSLALNKKFLSMLLLSLSIYSIPTFLFALPGMCGALLFLSHDKLQQSSFYPSLRGIFYFFCGSIIFAWLLYSPIWRDVFLKSHNFHGASSPTDFSFKLAAAISSYGEFISPTLTIAFLGITWIICATITSRNQKLTLEPLYRFSLMCAFTSIGGYLTCLVAILFVGINIPFLRSLCFIPLLFQISLGLLIEGTIRTCNKRLLVSGLNIFYWLQGFVGLLLIVKCFLLKSPLDYPNFMELTPSPLEHCIRSGVSFTNQELIAVEWNEPVLSMYRKALTYSTRYTRDDLVNYPCICGNNPPPPHQRIAFKDRGNFRLLCY